MTKNDQDDCLRLAKEFDLEARPYKGRYSGRSMYGAETYAIVVPSESAYEQICRIVHKTFKIDNLGKEFVVY